MLWKLLLPCKEALKVMAPHPAHCFLLLELTLKRDITGLSNSRKLGEKKGKQKWEAGKGVRGEGPSLDNVHKAQGSSGS